MELAKEFSRRIYVLANDNVRIVIDDTTVDVIIGADGQTIVALLMEIYICI